MRSRVLEIDCWIGADISRGVPCLFGTMLDKFPVIARMVMLNLFARG